MCNCGKSWLFFSYIAHSVTSDSVTSEVDCSMETTTKQGYTVVVNPGNFFPLSSGFCGLGTSPKKGGGIVFTVQLNKVVAPAEPFRGSSGN